MSDASHLRVPRLPWRRIVAAAAVVVGIGGIASPAPAVATGDFSPLPAAAEPSPGVFGDGVEGELSADLTIADSGLAAPGEDISGTVILNNRTDSAVGSGEIVIRISRTTIDTRYEHANWADPNESPSGSASGEEVLRLPIDAVGADGRLEIPVTIDATATDWLTSAEAGARGITVEWLIDDQARAQGNTTFVWNGASLPQPVNISPVVPVLAPIGEEALLTAAELEELTSTDGSLTELIAAVENTDATLAIDPRILVSIRALGTDAPASAVDWLETLESLANPSFALEFADASATLQLAAGAEAPLEPLGFEYATDDHAFVEAAPTTEGTNTATPETSTPTSETEPPGAEAPETPATEPPTTQDPATEDPAPETPATETPGTPAPDTSVPAEPGATGSAEATQTADPAPEQVEPEATPEPDLEELLAFDYSRTDLVWPAAGTVSDLEALSPGSETVILDGSQVTLSPDRYATPSSQHRIDDTEVLVTDNELDDAVTQAITADSELQFQDAAAGVAALLAVIARELPNEQREIVVTLPRAVLDEPQRLGDLLDLLGETSWTQLEPVPAPAEDRAALTETELLPGYHSDAAIARTNELFDAEDRGFALTTLYSDPDEVAHELRAELLATLANAVIVTDRWGVIAGEFVRSAIGPDAQIQVVAGSEIQLIGHDSSLPLFIENGTDRDVIVEVRLRPTTGHLKTGDATTITIPANSVGRATLPVQAIANGVSGVEATLWTVDDVQLRGTADLTVNVNASLETYAIVLLIGGGILLFGFGIWRTIRRRKRERAAEVRESTVAPAGEATGETSDSESVND